MRPGVFARRRQVRARARALERAPRRTKAAGDAPFDRRGVRGKKPVGGADLIVRVGVVWVFAEARLAERLRACDGVAKGRRERRIRRRSRHRRARLAEVVVDRDRALLEEQHDPRGCREQAIVGRVGGIDSDGFPERHERVSVVEVVAELEALGAQCRCGGNTGARRLGTQTGNRDNGRDDAENGDANEIWPHGVRPEGRVGPERRWSRERGVKKG